MGQGHDVGLAHPRLQRLENVLIDAVDHGTSLGKEHDLIVTLDLPGPHHRLLAVHHLQSLRLEGEEHRRLGHVHAQLLTAQAFRGQSCLDLAGGAGVEARLGTDRPLQTGVAADRVLVVIHVR